MRLDIFYFIGYDPDDPHEMKSFLGIAPYLVPASTCLHVYTCAQAATVLQVSVRAVEGWRALFLSKGATTAARKHLK